MISSQEIKQKTRSLGIDLCGIASIDRFNNLPDISNPSKILPGCNSVIVIAKHFLILNSKVVFVLSLIVIVTTFLLVILLGEKSIFRKLIISLSIIYIELFIFLFLGLYFGVRIIGGKKIIDKFNTINSIYIDSGYLVIGDGFLVILLSIIISILVAIVFTFLFWIFVNIIWGTIFILIITLYWIFYNAYKIVFKRSKKCHKNIFYSFFYSLIYSTIYTGWIFILLFIWNKFFFK